MSELELTVERLIDAPIEKVYQAWLNPTMLAKFMIPVEGVTTKEIEVDPRVGGRFKIVMLSGEDSLPHEGEYLELTPHSKIVFTWESPFSMEGSVVTLRLTQEGTSTLISLHHVKFPSEESRNNHNGGWTNILETLNAIIRA